MTDYYKILNLTIEASEAQIKKQFRKLATIHHPDKNSGSKKSEETFKKILNAYEILSNKEKRTIYDIKYKQHFQQNKSVNDRYTYAKTKDEQIKPNQNNYSKYPKNEKSIPDINYRFLIVIIFLVVLYLYNFNKSTTTGNSKADKILEEPQTENRPESGEIDFKK